LADELRPAKTALRRRVLAERAALPPAAAAAKSAAACAALLGLPEWRAAGCVLLFSSLPGEVATGELVDAALRQGKRVALPRIVTPPTGRRYLELRALPAAPDGPGAAAALVPGTWGILEPPAEAPLVPPAAVDLAVVPGVAFDRRGARLGYGGGFYDRLLPQLRPGVPAFGLAFGLQVVAAVPVGPNDVTLAGIITEDGVLYLTGK